MKNEVSIFERVNSWIRNSVSLKLLTITILALLLLIPASMIQSVIYEREQLSNEAVGEVSAKWANAQLVKGPVLTIPMVFEYEKDKEPYQTTRYFHILPEQLRVEGEIFPEKLRRGIYEIVVYKSLLSVSGSFTFDHKTDYANLKSVTWEDAFLTIGISDLRGIEEDVVVKWGDRNLKVQPGSRVEGLIPAGFTVPLPSPESLQAGTIDFKFDLKLQGSQNMSFVPLGSTTAVRLQSPWASPSFAGSFLPDERDVTEKGFSADWKVLQLNRNFPQSWLGESQYANIDEAAFGVNLLLPIDDYQKSMRSAKYALMTIALTFLVFFLVEVITARKIHPFQYTLIGLALCLFYILLISISEHSNFNLAYFISAAATVCMVGLYSLSVFKQKKQAALLSVILSGLYGFLFVTLQLADYALLMGSIGLAVILSVAMYFTRNINWYDLSFEQS